jgi:hypothetical protein
MSAALVESTTAIETLKENKKKKIEKLLDLNMSTP